MKLIEILKDRNNINKKPLFRPAAYRPEKVTKISTEAVILTSFTILLVTLMSICYVGICAQNVKSQYTLSRLKEKKIALEKTRLNLKLEVSKPTNNRHEKSFCFESINRRCCCHRII